ncbi:hypothetical protein FVEN_g10840 [Fusarium venenatum]|uniref:C3H1-type domain-containing protein n=1 Tax=Fusarium venenatum TaxID=56646 RepID=A0A2L2TSJ5_9HYPO|nr:uncharacterized protein FVRRES_00592 [Fusarium venenatum]KAG8351002.1 hypothetical protein FVEN_g10840 [Fusarium venenatum]KAH7006171.1 hypothetical protein EDB82DRAFT_109640 [Fusarium venenatum]CEI64080.1 unnamed protein product [Fusarium venenatum]
MTFTPKPQFFLIRPGAEEITPTGQIVAQPATAVPLIPADLLPDWVEVVGVPRSLSEDETKDIGNLGVIHAEQYTYKLRFDPITGDDACASDEVEEENPCESVMQPSASIWGPSISHDTSREEQNPETLTSLPSHTSALQVKLKPAQGLSSSRHNPENQQQQKSIVDKEPSPLQPNTTSPSSELPSPCRHWCHHGVCKWGLDCHYEHTMPTTSTGLAEVGLSQFPDWWLQARGVMPMPPEMLRAADASSARRMDRKIMSYTKRKPRSRARAKRVDARPVDLDEASEVEAEDEYEEEPETEHEVAQEPKREREGVLIEF